MDDGRPRFTADRQAQEKLAGRFFDAFRDGDVDGMRHLLAADVHLVGDGGGKAPQWAREIVGAENVARLLAVMLPPLQQVGVTVARQVVNGQPGALLRDRDGRILNTLVLEVTDRGVESIRAVLNPEKLTHLGPVADPWALVQELKRDRSGR